MDSKTLAYDFDEEALGFGEPQGPNGGGNSEGHASGEPSVSLLARVGSALVALGVLCFVLVLAGLEAGAGWGRLALTVLPVVTGAVLLFWACYGGKNPGIRNDGVFFGGLRNRGLLGWMLGVGLTGFYVILYFYEEWQGLGLPALLERPTRLLDPLAELLSGQTASRWFLYGFLYTAAVLTFGVRMFWKYRHNRYQLLRTGSVMGFQLLFAFLIPNLLKLFHQPEFYFSYFWPLKREYLFPETLNGLWSGGGFAQFALFWTVALALVGVPLLTWAVGKRWYCSWVCGCGGLAETLGDPWRQLSSKKRSAWKIERWLIHSVLVFVVLVTVLLWGNSARRGEWLGEWSSPFAKAYGFWIGAIFSGVIGVGFYPLLGSRVWCRFGCPQAAILGLVQRLFSRFRITTNGGQCMSCGNCSTYCEMGIDVRAYAQQSLNIVRASCVGCGVCAAVCPRGVLRLENGLPGDRFESAEHPWATLMSSLQTMEAPGYRSWSECGAPGVESDLSARKRSP